MKRHVRGCPMQSVLPSVVLGVWLFVAVGPQQEVRALAR
jgi:hypothetical protein